MAAAALAEICGASPAASLSAAAMAVKNILGLVCDPVAGLVECPCIKRNAMGAANAVLAADMALAGISSIIPFDEVVGAMRSVGRLMNVDLRETARGGLAATATALEITKNISMETKISLLQYKTNIINSTIKAAGFDEAALHSGGVFWQSETE